MTAAPEKFCRFAEPKVPGRVTVTTGNTVLCSYVAPCRSPWGVSPVQLPNEPNVGHAGRMARYGVVIPPSTSFAASSCPFFTTFHTPHASAVCEAPADCGTAGVFPTRKPRTQQPARAQLSFPAQVPSSERCPSCCCCRRSALRAVCAPPHYSRATKSATTATRALLQIYLLRLTRRRVWLQTSG